MVIKINNKPIRVDEDVTEAWYKQVNWVYTGVSMTGYLLALWVMDFAGYVFLGHHPIPAITWVGSVLHFIGRVLEWLPF